MKRKMKTLSGVEMEEERRIRKKTRVETQVLINKIFLGRPIQKFSACLGLRPISGLAPFIRVGTGMHY